VSKNANNEEFNNLIEYPNCVYILTNLKQTGHEYLVEKYSNPNKLSAEY